LSTCHDDVVTQDVRRGQISAAQRHEILGALIEAITNRQQVLDIVSKAPSAGVAQSALRAEFGWSEVSSIAVLDMQVRRFSTLERQRLVAECEELEQQFQVSVSVRFPQLHDVSDQAWLDGAAWSCGGLTARPTTQSNPPQGTARFQDDAAATEFVDALVADGRFSAWIASG
jgi:hypothetical protein